MENKEWKHAIGSIDWTAGVPKEGPVFHQPPFSCVLTGSSLDSADSQRRIMVAMDYFLTHLILHPGAPELKPLEESERRLVDRTVASIRCNPRHTLLLEATLKFIEARSSDDHSVLLASRELAFLGEFDSITLPNSYPKEYAKIRAKFNRSQGLDQSRPTQIQDLIHRVSVSLS
jgi:hypothetical protein